MANAFATGRSPSHAVVCVTTGLLQQLDRPELEAVLAHELTHIKNRDVMVITIASFLSTVAFMIVRFSFWFGGGMFDRRRDRDGANWTALAYLAALLVWVVSLLLIRTLSRYREFAADRGSAIITGAPSQLSSALLKISGRMQRIPEQDLREVQGANAFFIVPALRGESILGLFSTHPSLEKRLERLQKMEREMEGV
jgi:heat shock protein HtpX